MRDWARQARTGHFRFGRPRVDYEDKLAAVTLPALGISFTTDFFATRRAMDGLLGKLPGLRLERHHLDPKALGFEKIDHFRSEEHTSELQSLMRISYAVFCLK